MDCCLQARDEVRCLALPAANNHVLPDADDHALDRVGDEICPAADADESIDQRLTEVFLGPARVRARVGAPMVFQAERVRGRARKPSARASLGSRNSDRRLPTLVLHSRG